MKTLIGILVLLAATSTLAAGWPEAWINWRYGAPIAVAPTTADQLASMVVPATVTTRARRGWSDLRVIDGEGREVPFLLHAQFGGRTSRRQSAALLEPTTVAGSYRQVVADAGASPSVHNSMILQINTDANLMAFVEIAVGTDMKSWNVIRDRAPIYVLAKEDHSARTEVTYPDSASRYVRVRILDGTTPYSVVSATIAYEVYVAPERAVVSTTLVPSEPAGRFRRTVWTSEGDLSAIPVAAVTFTTSVREFARRVTVEASDDGTDWRVVTAGPIQSGGTNTRPKLTVDEFSETYSPRWRISVAHQNDAPIADLRPALLTVPRRVVFRPDAGAAYRLIWGNPRGMRPRYDLEQLSDAKMIGQAAAATLGAEEENTGWVDPTPWTERYRLVLWIAMAGAAILLAVAAVRAVRTPAGQPSAAT